MIKDCTDCKTTTLEELGTAGFMSDGKYHNRHEWRCVTCHKRFDENDCTCDRTCKSNFEHHKKYGHVSLIDGRKG
ncbi:MAG: hypothetical protein ACREBA_01030 [Nitrosotalea sp.]